VQQPKVAIVCLPIAVAALVTPDRIRQCNSLARIGLSLAKDLWVARPLRRNAQHPGFERGRAADVAFVGIARHEGSFARRGIHVDTHHRRECGQAPCAGEARAAEGREAAANAHPVIVIAETRKSAIRPENCTADMLAPSRIRVPDSQPLGFGAKADFAASAAGALRARRKGAWPNFIATSFQRAS
jgi:hypothetical protein